MKSLVSKIIASTLLCTALFIISSCDQPKQSTSDPLTPGSTNPGNGIPHAGYPDWSPTGERLAFVRDSMIYVYYFSDKHIEALTVGTEPNFSPDGARLTFERNKKIYWIDLTTKQETFLADGITPNWSANGNSIAFANEKASRLLTDGTIVYGEMSPDSSLYYYDLQNATVKRVIVTNYDSLYIGSMLSMFSPVWAMHDSILLFSSEFGIWKVKTSGGRAVLFARQFPPNVVLEKNQQGEELGNSGQERWNEATRNLVWFQNTAYGVPGFLPVIASYNFDTDILNAPIAYHVSDPCWSPDGKQIACYRNDSVQIINFK